MRKSNLKLWEDLSNFSLDNPEADFSFSQRLARENGWNLAHSLRVIEEYKKFIYMSVVTGKSLTPSDEVDQAWHLHLIYSYSYWVEMCEKTLGGFRLHHGPTKGGLSENKRYDNQYSKTLEFYREEFGYEAPADIWPSNDIRFGKVNFRRVSLHDNYILSKEKFNEYALNFTTVLCSLFAAALFLSAKPSDSKIELSTIIWIIVGVICVLFLVRGIYRYMNRNSRNRSSGSSTGSSSSSDSGCTIVSSFFGCGIGCGSDGGSSGCSSSGCSSSGCGGCGGCGS